MRGSQLGQSLDRSDIAERVLVNVDGVARNLCVDGSFEKETQQRVERVIRLMEGDHGGAVGLFLEFVVALSARPQRLPDRDIARQLAHRRLGDRLPRAPFATRPQVLGHGEDAGADEPPPRFLAFFTVSPAPGPPPPPPVAWALPGPPGGPPPATPSSGVRRRGIA